MAKLFFLVLARDRKYIMPKMKELEALGVPYKIVCGEHVNHCNVAYRPPRGKYDAINFGARLVPKDVDIVAMNDVDTKIHNFQDAVQLFSDDVDMVFGTEAVTKGPQRLFFRMMNPIRRKIPIAASGELMLVRYRILQGMLPLKPCKAEDTYMLFKVLEQGHKIVFCESCYAETERTKTAEKEEAYKRKTVTGIYQALSYTRPPVTIRLFYIILPVMSPLLLILGKKGYFWMRGILLGISDFLRGDKTGMWQTDYMD